MGIVCELYRMSDSDIGKLKEMNPDEAENFLYENYANTEGKYHKYNDTVFSMDKGWAIARFLIKQNDKSEDNFLKILDQNFIESENVKRVSSLFNTLESDKIKALCDRKLMVENRVYLAKRLETWTESNYWNYILPHIETFKKAFKKASELNSGIAFGFH